MTRALVGALVLACLGGLGGPAAQADVARQKNRIAWKRQVVPAAGVSVLLHPDWAVDSRPASDRGVIYQVVTHDGVRIGFVFVRYGPDDTVAKLLETIAMGSGIKRTIERDEKIRIHGLRARRVTLRFEEPEREGHRSGPSGIPQALPPRERRHVIKLLGLSVDGTPVVIGYQLDVPQRRAYGPILDGILRSVRPL